MKRTNMNQRLLVMLALMLLLIVVAAGVWMGTAASSEDQEQFERLARVALERNVEATQNIIDWSCACADEDDQGRPECSDGPLISDDEWEPAKSCVIEAAAGVDADIPPGLDNFLICLDSNFDDVDECIHRLTDDEGCSGDGALLMLECSVAMQAHRCGQTDDVTHQWLDKFADRVEDYDCHSELMVNLHGFRFDEPPDAPDIVLP